MNLLAILEQSDLEGRDYDKVRQAVNETLDALDELLDAAAELHKAVPLSKFDVRRDFDLLLHHAAVGKLLHKHRGE
jgi:hypothetical protein